MSTYDCQYCNRNYKEKFNYDRHLLCCEFLFKSRREQNHEIDLLGPIPSQREMYQLIQYMSVRIDKLEKENIRLRQVNTRKYNILEQLNSEDNITKMNITFSEWIKKHILPEVHNSLQKVYSNDLLEGLKDVILRAINKFDLQVIPIRTFENSTSFYIFNRDKDDNNSKKWMKILLVDLDKYLRRISNQFLYDFKEYWYDKHSDLIETTEKYNDLYLNYHGKILGGNTSEDTLFQKLRKHIFINVKHTTKSVIEYTAS
jgi:hypothetical protein